MKWNSDSFLNIDHIDHRKLILLWIIFLATIMSLYLSAELFVPHEFKLLQIDEGNTLLRFQLAHRDTVAFSVSNLTRANQFILPKLYPVLISENEPFEANFEVKLNVLTISNQSLLSKTMVVNNKWTDPSNLTRKDKSVFLPYVFNFKESKIYFDIKISGASELAKKVKELEVRVETNNEDFFAFVFYLKTFFFVLSIATTTSFFSKYFLQLKPTRIVEQKLTLWLSYLLVCYNCPLSFYFDSLTPSVPLLLFSSLINISFYTFLSYFWVVVFEVVYTHNRFSSRDPQQAWKVLFSLVQGASGFITYSMEAFYFVNDPLNVINENYSSILSFFKVLYICLIVLNIIYIAYCVVHLHLSYGQVLPRHKIFYIFSLYFIFTINLFILTGNTFVFYQNGERAHLVITLSNIYVLLLQYLYRLSDHNIVELRKFVKVEYRRRDPEGSALNACPSDDSNIRDENLEVERI